MIAALIVLTMALALGGVLVSRAVRINRARIAALERRKDADAQWREDVRKAIGM